MAKKGKFSRAPSHKRQRKAPLQSDEDNELAPLLQGPDKKETDLRKLVEDHAERARVNGFVQLGYLPYIFAREEGYSAILPRLWHFFECDGVKDFEQTVSRYEAWFWIFQRWGGISQGSFWKHCKPIDHLPLYDPITRRLKKEVRWGRSDKDPVILEDLKTSIEKVSKNLNLDFPLPLLLYPGSAGEKQEATESLTFSPDFCCVNKDGENITLTSKQSHVIQTLLEAQRGKNPELTQAYIIEKVSPDTSTRRLRDFFKGNPQAWKALIEKGSRKGTFRLKR